MKKTFRKALSILLALSVIVTGLFGLTACGKKNDPNTIYISIINKGYGNQWIGSLMGKFLQTDSAYADYKYELINSYDDSKVKTEVEGGSKHVYYDLVVHAGNSTMINDQALYDISNVYSMSYKDGKLADYIDQSILSSFVKQKDDGTEFYTSIPWAKGVRGLLINYDVVTEALGADWESNYPIRTTNEFIVFINALNQNLATNKRPFVMYSQDNYYDGLYEIWWAQFEGMKGVENYYKARYEEGGDVKEGQKAFLQEGRLHSLKVMEEIFTKESNYEIYTDWNGMQAAYMEGKSAMLVNGDWLYNEMGEKYQDKDIRFVKAPVISALGAELGLSTATEVEGDNMEVTYDVTEESKFIEVIDYVDKINNGEQVEKPVGVSDDIIAKITEARNMVYSNVDYSCMSIPSYSTKAEVMVKFIQWMYSDAGQREYVSAMKGLTLPINNDVTDGITLSGFASTLKNLTKNAVYVFPNRNWKYAKAGLISFSARKEGPVEYLLTGKSNTPDCDSAFEIYMYDYNYYNKGNNWALLQAGAK